MYIYDKNDNSRLLIPTELLTGIDPSDAMYNPQSYSFNKAVDENTLYHSVYLGEWQLVITDITSVCKEGIQLQWF